MVSLPQVVLGCICSVFGYPGNPRGITAIDPDDYALRFDEFMQDSLISNLDKCPAVPPGRATLKHSSKPKLYPELCSCSELLIGVGAGQSIGVDTNL